MKIAILCALFFGATNLSSVEAQSFHSPAYAYGQSKTAPVVFSFVRGHKLGKGYSVQWNMGSNAPVERFEVQSTYEDPNDEYSTWTTVGTVESRRGQSIFRYTDQSILFGVISYRVVAYMSNARGYEISPFFSAVLK